MTAPTALPRDEGPKPSAHVIYRAPRPADAKSVHRLVRDSGGLEVNTGYAYVLLCDHFASTSAVAERGGELVGFVGGYVPPSRPHALFVWQVGVHPAVRGFGVASGLLDAAVRSAAGEGARYLEATVTPSNAASRRLFESFARRHHAPFAWSEGYAPSLFDGAHEPEHLIRIGPVAAPSFAPSA